MGEGFKGDFEDGQLAHRSALFVDINFYEDEETLTSQESLMVILYSLLWLVA